MSEGLLAGFPTPAAQAAVLRELATLFEPLRLSHRLPPYELLPGARLRRAYGSCLYRADAPPRVLVRCTRDDDRARWREWGAIVSTLLHELAHLRYRGHGSRFWALHRRLLDDAEKGELYDPSRDDPTEASRGAEKLAGSAADLLAQAARERRRVRAAANRAAARHWTVGSEAVVGVRRGRLKGARVRVTAVGRGWLTVQAPGNRSYRVAASLLLPADAVRS